MAGVNANFEFGPSVTIGTAAQSKSFAYDEAQYVYSQFVPFFLNTLAGTSGALGGGQYKYVAPTGVQVRSITLVPILGTAVLAGGGDYIQVYLASAYAQAFGTATGPSYFVAGINTGTFYGSSTNTGTNINLVTVFNVMTFMTGQAGAVLGTGSLVAGTAGVTPQIAQFDNGTYTVVVANSLGTATQGGYVFPIGPQGGLTLQPGDVLIIAKGTDTVMGYAGQLEVTYTPGAYVTR